MRILLGLCACGLLVLTSCSKDKEYQETAKMTIDSMATYAHQCNAVTADVSEAWKKAINSSTDFNEAIALELGILRAGGLDSIQANRLKWVEENMKKLNEPSEKLKPLHDKIVEMYGLYTQLHSLAWSPAGSLLTYNRNTDDLIQKIDGLKSETSILFTN